MLMHNLLEYSDNYSVTLGIISQWSYCSDEVNDDTNENILLITTGQQQVDFSSIRHK